MNAFLKFIKSLRSLYNQGVIKSVDEAMEFAKNEFGEITEFLEAQIKKVFKKAPEKKKKSEGIMDAEVVNIDSKKIVDERTDDLMGKNEKSEGIMDIADKMSKKADELKKLVDESKVTEKSIIEDALDAATGFQRPLGSKDKSKPFRTHKMEYKRDSEDYRIPGGSSYAEGNLRTAIRQFLRTEAKEGRLKLSDDDMFRITEYSPMMEDDPIDVFRRYYGEDALERADDMADALELGESFKHYEEIFRKEMGDLKVKTEGAGQYDQSILDAERIMKEAAEEAKNKKILEDFDPTDRDKNATGGRPGYAFGTGLKLLKLFGGAKKLQKAIDDAVDNLNPSGDKKLDADNAIDDMLEEAGIDRDEVDQYDIVDAYGKAYERITSGKVFKQVDDMLEEQFPGVTEQIEAVTKRSGESIKRDTIARRLGLDPFKLNEQQKMILDKYGNRIDDDLLKNILVDDDPQRIAEVSATLDEAFIMQDKGMGPDEILETVKNTKRTKQAMGTGPDGLSEITELFEKIRIKNVQKQKDQEDNKQMRFRKLLASNKFPELNTFLEAELNEDDEKVELDVRTNLAVGGSPFTAEQLAQKKQQSYLDYLARRGVGQTGGGSNTTAPTFNPFTPVKGTTPPASGGSQPGTGGGGITSPNTGTGGGGNTNTGTGNTFYGKGNTGGGTGGSSGGSSGGTGGTSSGGSNVYTGSGNFPPGMGTNTGGGSAGSSGGSSGLTPNTGNSNVGGGGFGGTGSIVGGGTGSAPGYQSRLDEYKAYVERNKNDPTAALSPNSFFTQKELLASPELQDAAYKDVYNPGREFQKQVQAGYDTGDLGSEAANDAAYRGDPNSHPDYLAFKQMSSKEQRALLEPFMDRARDKSAKDPPSQRNFENVLGYAKDFYKQSLMGADANDGFEDGLKESTYDEDAEDEQFGYRDAEGNPVMSEDQSKKEQFDFLREKGILSSQATLEDYKKGRYAGSAYSPRDPNLWKAEDGSGETLYDRLEKKYGEGVRIEYNKDKLKTYEDMSNRQAGLTSPRSDGKYADQVNARNAEPVSIGGGLKKFAGKIYNAAGQVVDTAGRILDSRPGQLALTVAKYKSGVPILETLSKVKTAVDTVNKGRDIVNQVKNVYDQSIDDILMEPTGIGGNIDLREENKTGGRVGKAVGGSIDLEARKRQSYKDFLARQPGAQPQTPTAPPAQPATPQPKPNFPKPFPMTPGGPKPATPITPATTAAQPQPAGPFDMSKYQGGTFTGGIEDSRNISLNQLAELGVDVSKYRTMTPTDTSGPKFKGLSLNEIFAMDLNTAKEKLGFDPSVEGANPEFEEFLRVNDPGPQLIGPGGPPGMKTEFKNQDELAQILNRAIPFYMRTARDLGENYTLQEMLAMTDEELAALDDRYDKKMGYGKYAKRPGNIYNTGSTDKSQAQETMEYYSSNIQPQGTGIGLGSQYATGGRVGFKFGGVNKKVKKYMKPDYDKPFDKISKSERSKFNKLTSTLSSYAKNLNKLKKKKATTAAQKNLLIQNEKARKNALKRLEQLKKLYSGGKSV